MARNAPDLSPIPLTASLMSANSASGPGAERPDGSVGADTYGPFGAPAAAPPGSGRGDAGTDAPPDQPLAADPPLAAVRRSERLVDAFEAGRRRRASEDASEIRLMADAAASVARPAHATPEQCRRAELDRRALVADLATSGHVSEWTVNRLLSESADLCERFAAGVEALSVGRISRQHLSVIHDAGDPIVDDAARARFLTIALDRAAQLTPGRLAPVLRVVAERFLERTREERHRDAAARRTVELVDLPDNLAAITLINDVTLIHGIHDRLTAQARSVISARKTADDAWGGDKAEGDVVPEGGIGDGLNRIELLDGATAGASEPADERTMDQLRADIFTDTLLTAGPQDCVAGTGLAAIRATVQITVPVLTMTGASTEPCLLAGYGPIDSDTARALAAGAPGWDRVMTSPVTGTVLAVDRYRPGPALQRFLAARDEHCRFPGCRRAVRRCDIDHTHDAARGGPTAHTNLAHLCRRHHVLKHHTAWTVEQTSPGVLVWTSPTGRRHTDRPEPVVRFTPEPDAERRRRLREPWRFGDQDPSGPGDPPPF